MDFPILQLLLKLFWLNLHGRSFFSDSNQGHMFCTLLEDNKEMKRTFYRLTGVITHAGYRKNLRQLVIYNLFTCSSNIPSKLLSC